MSLMKVTTPGPTGPLMQFAGESLGYAIRKLVFEDQQVVDLGSRITESEKRHHAVFAEGQFPGPFETFQWPVDLTVGQLEYAFESRPIYLMDDPLPEPSDLVRAACCIIVRLWTAAMEPLKSGNVVVFGTHAASGLTQRIDQMLWRRANLWLELRNSDLLEECRGKPIVTWSGLSLKSAFEFHVNSTAHDGLPASTLKRQASTTAQRPRHKSDLVLKAMEKADIDPQKTSLTPMQIAHAISKSLPDEFKHQSEKSLTKMIGRICARHR